MDTHIGYGGMLCSGVFMAGCGNVHLVITNRGHFVGWGYQSLDGGVGSFGQVFPMEDEESSLGGVFGTNDSSAIVWEGDVSCN